MKVRLKDVAAKAGVAVNTASTILNRRPNSWASKATAERVFTAAEELGYRPNRTAVALRSGRFNAIALLLPDLNNPFYCALADLLAVEAGKRGNDLVIESWRSDLARERHCLGEVADRQVDGVVAILSDNEPHHDFLADQFKRGRPFVTLSQTGGAALPVDTVVADFTQGLNDAIDALQRLGHRRFGFVCALAKGQEDHQRQEMLRGTLQRHGIGADGFQFVRCEPHIASAHTAATQLLSAFSQRPTAVIALSDLAAMATMRAARDLGMSIPRDLSLVGVDDISLVSYLPVSLSSIALPMQQMAEMTCALLFDRIANPTKPGIEQASFATRFIQRESVGPAPKVMS